MTTKNPYCSSRHGTPNGAAMPAAIKCPSCGYGCTTWDWHCYNCKRCLKCQRIVKQHYEEFRNKRVKVVPKFEHTRQIVRNYRLIGDAVCVSDVPTGIVLNEQQTIELLDGNLDLLR